MRDVALSKLGLCAALCALASPDHGARWQPPSRDNDDVVFVCNAAMIGSVEADSLPWPKTEQGSLIKVSFETKAGTTVRKEYRFLDEYAVCAVPIETRTEPSCVGFLISFEAGSGSWFHFVFIEFDEGKNHVSVGLDCRSLGVAPIPEFGFDAGYLPVIRTLTSTGGFHPTYTQVVYRWSDKLRAFRKSSSRRIHTGRSSGWKWLHS